jgi:hypothetical protein
MLCRLGLHVWGIEDYDGWHRDDKYGETCAVCSKERTTPPYPKVEYKYEPMPIDREMYAQMTRQVQEMYAGSPRAFTYANLTEERGDG